MVRLGLLVSLVVAAVGCTRPLGALRDADAGLRPDGGVRSDGGARPDSGVDGGVDSGIPVDTVGWYGTDFEHSGFVEETWLLPGSLDGCPTRLFAPAGGETWWVQTVSDDRAVFPHFGSTFAPRAGLLAVRGTVSPLRPSGHLGLYDRDLWIDSASLLLCRSVELSGHCLVPDPNDLCLFPPPHAPDVGVVAQRFFPGPGPSALRYEVQLADDEGVGHADPVVVITFSLPFSGPRAGWESVAVADVPDLTLTEYTPLAGPATITYRDLSGWVARDATDRLRLSVAGDSDFGPRHIWGAFVLEDVFLP